MSSFPHLRTIGRPFPSILSAGLLVTLASACGDSSPSEPTPPGGEQVAAVEVQPGADTLFALDDTVTLTAVARDQAGEIVSDAGISWRSSAPNVVVVDGNGTATAVGNGAAVITASAADAEGTADLAVAQLASSVQVTPTSAVLTTVGDTARLSAEGQDENGNELAGADVVWQSENHAVATVSPSGLVTARGSGEAVITATVQDVPGLADVTVDRTVGGLRFMVAPSDAVAGEAIDPAVQVEVVDTAGNRVEDLELAVTLGLANAQTPATLEGTRTVGATAGVASFSGLSVDRVGTHTLRAVAGTDTATSAPFDIEPAEAAALRFGALPSTGTAGEVLAPAEVRVEDDFGNLVPTASPTVSVRLEDADTTALSGTTAVTAENGIATFDDLSVTEAGEHALTTAVDNDDNMASATGGPLEITPAAAHGLAFRVQPDAVEGHELMEPAVEVVVRDTFGNRVPSADVDVTIGLGQSPSSGPDPGLGGTLTAATTDGVAVFDALRVDRPYDGYTMLASASGLESAESTPFSVNLTFTDVAVGGSHTCAVTQGGEIYCWGDNDSGQLGTSSVDATAVPVRVEANLNFGTVTAGRSHTCATLRALTVQTPYCWGWNEFGQLGVGDREDRAVPTAVDGPAMTRVSAGTDHTCGLNSDGVYCWGSNSTGQLGQPGTFEASQVSPRQTIGGGFQAVAGGDLHSCAVDTDGTAYCWGHNDAGQLGDGSHTTATSPVTVDDSGGAVVFETITAGVTQTCGTFPGEDIVFCWGANNGGQLGTGDMTSSTTPRLTVGPDLVAVDAGSGYTCGISNASEAMCWGANGPWLGLGESAYAANVLSPTAVPVDGTFTAIEASHAAGTHTCALTTDGTVYCWGTGRAGELGNGSATDRYRPTPVIQ
ncbi:MAG: Ig-like domain-containing protein [Gemmatimonadota bacterium]|nr:Ig-like domain-containing protein [Gemmatimonadota bacterium]